MPTILDTLKSYAGSHNSNYTNPPLKNTKFEK